ncbi:arabinan endo-1,5-alpha-L-arabinosidase [Flavobacterium aquidurense]|uniref:Glycoside hydrolase n=1 Tax=Flavobacterium frigidimaris TaxID=262320 RepID=A0ABX4BM89_FLAFR|nr:glycoside hydrolase family 43 protein [Flavobacterium frigidimaris]OXA76701.1 glycoside hydrolase [Flavobacterium frigidimaris]SDZ66094.1 arabinan endo-1,5-alpha-L-arabinosidase [Flavobacterium aquidurense]
MNVVQKYYCFLITVLSLTGLESNAQQNTFVNPVYNKDFADPTVIKAADGYYYAYGTNTVLDGKNIHIQVLKSKNLVDWIFIGDALPTKPKWADKDFWAPHVLYDAKLKTYFLYYSGESDSKEGKCLGVATSKLPSGPFIDKGEPLLCGNGFINIDPMAFDDPKTGKKLLYWGSGFEALKVRELSEDRLSFKTASSVKKLVNQIINNDPSNYQNLVEGSWVTFHDGFYYLYYSGDNCCGEKAHYAVMVARSKNAEGPFETLAEAEKTSNSVILNKNDQWIAPGHNSVVTDEKGQEWMVYHAIDSKNPNGGRIVLIDKISYKNGWPIVNSGTPSSTNMLKPIIK